MISFVMDWVFLSAPVAALVVAATMWRADENLPIMTRVAHVPVWLFAGAMSWIAVIGIAITVATLAFRAFMAVAWLLISIVTWIPGEQ